MEKEILILANSRKPGGSCVAGKTEDHKWIRVVKKFGGSIPKIESSNLNLLSVYNFHGLEFEKDNTILYHTENHTYDNFNLIWTVSSEDELTPYLDNPSTIYGGTGRCLIASDALNYNYSLLFVKVKNLVICRKNTPYGVKNRCNFEYNGRIYYDISLTENTTEQRFNGKNVGYTERYDNAYITVSLGIIDRGYAYKLVAGIITVRQKN